MRLFILAGEPSGDRLAAQLVRDLRTRAELDLSGIGGAALVAEGLSPLFPMAELSVMGAVDVIRALPRLLARVRDTADAILQTKPDLVVLVDSQEFSARVARRLRRHGHSGPIVLYVAPAVWAHGAQRAARLRGVVDEILAVLPFEPEVFKTLGGPPTTYVGHPAADGAVPSAERGAKRDSVLLLPGSRRGELRRHLAGFRVAVERMAERRAELRFTILSLPHLVDEVRASTQDWGVETAISSGAAEREAWLARARIAICKSGTATLELALAEVPQVIAYALDPIQGIVYGRKGRPPVGLPNIILGERIVPELVSRELDGGAIADAALTLLDSEDAMERQRQAFGRLRRLMSEGDPLSPRQSAAERVLAHLGR